MHTDETPDRSGMLWRTLAGLFGADSLERKFGKNPPREWVGLLRTLNDFELQRGLKRLAFCGKGHVPTLPEFLRMCREVASDQYPDEQRQPLPQSHQLNSRQDARWEREGNIHLLSYVTEQSKHKIFYTEQDVVTPLLEAKAAWAEDMRDAEMAGNLPPNNGKAEWAACMANAEKVIAMIRKALAA
jgi:hypothetical protein